MVRVIDPALLISPVNYRIKNCFSKSGRSFLSQQLFNLIGNLKCFQFIQISLNKVM